MIALEPPIISLVTSRRALPGGSQDALVGFVSSAVSAGVTLVHLRERDLDDRRLVALASRIVHVVAGRAAVVINDRTDIALAVGANGVHLRGDGPPVERVRGMVPPDFLIGRAAHDAAEALAAAEAGADYVVLGTIHPSASKAPGAPVLGLGPLRRASRAGVPVLAIGGVTADNVGELAAAGAAGISGIGLFVRAYTAAPPADLSGLVAGIRRAFGRPATSCT